MIYYVFNQSTYVDFHTLLEVTKMKRTTLFRLVNNLLVEKIRHKNTLLYSLDDLVQKTEFFTIKECN